MLWVTVALFVVGVACGAVIRLLVFAGILVAGAVIAVVGTAAQGLGAALLTGFVTVVALQIGYVVGFVLRAMGRSLYSGAATRGSNKPPVSASLGEKRH